MCFLSNLPFQGNGAPETKERSTPVASTGNEAEGTRVGRLAAHQTTGCFQDAAILRRAGHDGRRRILLLLQELRVAAAAEANTNRLLTMRVPS